MGCVTSLFWVRMSMRGAAEPRGSAGGLREEAKTSVFREAPREPLRSLVVLPDSLSRFMCSFCLPDLGPIIEVGFLWSHMIPPFLKSRHGQFHRSSATQCLATPPLSSINSSFHPVSSDAPPIRSFPCVFPSDSPLPLHEGTPRRKLEGPRPGWEG